MNSLSQNDTLPQIKIVVNNFANSYKPFLIVPTHTHVRKIKIPGLSGQGFCAGLVKLLENYTEAKSI